MVTLFKRMDLYDEVKSKVKGKLFALVKISIKRGGDQRNIWHVARPSHGGVHMGRLPTVVIIATVV